MAGKLVADAKESPSEGLELHALHWGKMSLLSNWRTAKASLTENSSWFRYSRYAVVLTFCAALTAYVVISWRWPLIHDMQVLHYVSFLIDHGWAPYRQIGDMNMPGAYLFEGWALHLFGSSDLGWRLYDFTLSTILIVSMISIAKPYNWLAGLMAGGAFVLVHGSEGPMSAGQRDQLMAILLILGYAFGFESVRRRQAWMMFIFALATGMAASVKPTLVLIGPAMLLLIAHELRRRAVAARSFILWSVGGYVLASGIVLSFLISHGSMGAFVYDLTRVLPHYATVGAATWGHLVRLTLQVPIFIYVGFAVVAAVLDRNWGNWECKALLCGLGFGLINFYGQRKGFGQHRYTTVAFVLLWATIQMFVSLRTRGKGRGFALAGLAFLMVVDIPRNLQWMSWHKAHDDFSSYLEQDLERIGPAELQGKVQCLDIIDGCLTALFHLKIVQSTGSTGDLLLFLPQSSEVVDWARSGFLEQMKNHPPELLVLSNEPFIGPRTFGKVDAWPAFAAFLHENYTMIAQREFGGDHPSSHLGIDTGLPAYRIFLKRGSALSIPRRLGS